jgi:hypothetical protein
MIPKKLHFSWVHNDLEVAMVGPKVDLTFEHEVCLKQDKDMKKKDIY